jgi:hypothetical protein
MGKYPETFLFGVGIGRYNLVLNREYGSGAGYSLRGDIAPLNSQFYEILFDLGALGILIFYGGLAMLVVKIGKQSMLAFTFWSLLIFLTLQSLSIQNLQLTVFVAGGGVAYLRFWKLRNHTDPRMIATGYGLK